MAYLRSDELHTAFNFSFLTAPWRADTLRASIASTIASHATVGAPPTWVIGNHDVCRPVSRYARNPELTSSNDRFLSHFIDRPAAFDIGLQRARAAALLSLALPGGAYIYNGEELGLPEVEDLPIEVKQDPMVAGTGGVELGRDGCRVPLPWTPDGVNFGFSPAGGSPAWLPQPTSWGGLSVAAQQGRPGSTLELYREALRLRHELDALGDGDLAWIDTSAEQLAFQRGDDFACWVNFSHRPVPMPDGWRVLLASDEMLPGTIAPYAAAWLTR